MVSEAAINFVETIIGSVAPGTSKLGIEGAAIRILLDSFDFYYEQAGSSEDQSQAGTEAGPGQVQESGETGGLDEDQEGIRYKQTSLVEGDQ